MWYIDILTQGSVSTPKAKSWKSANSSANMSMHPLITSSWSRMPPTASMGSPSQLNGTKEMWLPYLIRATLWSKRQPTTWWISIKLNCWRYKWDLCRFNSLKRTIRLRSHYCSKFRIPLMTTRGKLDWRSMIILVRCLLLSSPSRLLLPSIMRRIFQSLLMELMQSAKPISTLKN